ncbi:ABC-2 type transport system permease protein [Agrobacterium fabrum]|uniref:ABC-2 type transport system permease protein n=1 Tax=Agrobacterium fabrum TaxID=1176649 RepID=A0A7Z7FSU3_9HYPH|nr:ABC transporter permease [Agrobacterium fabrum]SDJ98549.1 ABC-2 type transport system permease protein [Agrobacterium fabrum]
MRLFSSNIFQLGIKELRGLARDGMLLLLIVYAFTLQIYTGSSALPETLNNAAIAIVDEDQSPLSGRISTAFYPPYFAPPKQISIAEMDKRMDAGLDTFALNIPPDFQRRLMAGQQPAIQLNIDATRMSQAFSGGGYVQNIVTSEVQEYVNRYRGATTVPVDLTLRSRFNPELDKSWFGSINNIITAITMLSIVLTGAALIREREHGTVEHLLVMPVTPLEIMLSKVWSMGLVVLVASAFSLFVLGTALQLFAMTSMGIFLATVAGSMPQFGMLLILFLLPLQVLSGAMTPRESMPDIIQYIMLLAPNTHFVILAQSVLFRGAGLDVVWPQLLALLAIGSALFIFALRRFRRFLR